MNFGFFACVCARLCREVHGFEPIAALIQRAEHNRALNNLANVSMNRVALSNKDGTVVLHLPPTESTNWGTASLLHDQGGESVEVKSTTVDHFCMGKGLKRLDFMKIDVEGAEHLVLEGARKALGTFRPAVIFENNGGSSSAAMRVLESCGYRLYSLSGHQLDPGAVRPGRPTDLLALPAGQPPRHPVKHRIYGGSVTDP
jgi:FkbM family methyltransferase